MSFHIGQKVVCINDTRMVQARCVEGWFAKFRPFILLDHNLNRGDQYVITGLQMMRTVPSGNEYLFLMINGARHFEIPSIGFPSFQFRALIEKKTDIGVFTEILNRENSKVQA